MDPTDTPVAAAPDREEPIFCAVLLPHEPKFERPTELREPIDYARALVIDLLNRTGNGIEWALLPERLHVIIGEGNWVSFDCEFHPEYARSAENLADYLEGRAAEKVRGL